MSEYTNIGYHHVYNIHSINLGSVKNMLRSIFLLTPIMEEEETIREYLSACCCIEKGIILYA